MSDLILDCLNCSRITALSDRLSSLEAKVWTVLIQPEYLNHDMIFYIFFTLFFNVFLCQVQLFTAPTSVSHRHPQGKGGTIPEASLLKGSVPAQGAPGEQGPAGISRRHAWITFKLKNTACFNKVESRVLCFANWVRNHSVQLFSGSCNSFISPPFTLTSAHILFPPLDGCSFPWAKVSAQSCPGVEPSTGCS